MIPWSLMGLHQAISTPRKEEKTGSTGEGHTKAQALGLMTGPESCPISAGPGDAGALCAHLVSHVPLLPLAASSLLVLPYCGAPHAREAATGTTQQGDMVRREPKKSIKNGPVGH